MRLAQRGLRQALSWIQAAARQAPDFEILSFDQQYTLRLKDRYIDAY